MQYFGHTFPVLFGFKVGKGVATALGVIITINYQIGLICLVFALVLMILTKMVSVGSIAAAILFPVLVFFISDSFNLWSVIVSALIACLVVFNHRSNIKILLNRNRK